MSTDANVATKPSATPWGKTEDQLKAQLQARLEELEPLLVEREEIQDKLSALDPTFAPTSRRRRYSSGTRRVARGEHDLRFLGIVTEHPGNNGMSVAEVFHEYQSRGFDVQAPYLYKVASRLVEKGNLRKDGERYFPIKEAVKA